MKRREGKREISEHVRTMRPDLEGWIESLLCDLGLNDAFSVRVETFRRNKTTVVCCDLFKGGLCLGSQEHPIDQHDPGFEFDATTRTAELLTIKLIHDATKTAKP